jgi:hypothetical protein
MSEISYRIHAKMSPIDLKVTVIWVVCSIHSVHCPKFVRRAFGSGATAASTPTDATAAGSSSSSDLPSAARFVGPE